MGTENTIMRTVSFVERIEIEYHGNIIKQTMVLADVDNDKANELVVGDIEGHIAIFKGDSSTPWKRTSLSGMLTCLSVGCIQVANKNSLVCMTAEGWCYVYDISAVTPLSFGGDDSEDSRHFKPVFTQELPANARDMRLADVDNDNHVEMIIGYSDRVVRLFKWVVPHDPDSGHFVPLQKWQLASQIGSITINYDKELRPEIMVSQPGATFVSLQLRPQFRHIKSDSHLDKMGGQRSNTGVERSGTFSAGQGPCRSKRGEGVFFTKAGETLSNLSLNSENLSNLSSKSEENCSKVTDLKSFHNSIKQEVVPLSSKSEDGQDVCSKDCVKQKDVKKSEGHSCMSQGRLAHLLDSSFDVKRRHSYRSRVSSEDSYLIYHPLAHSQIRNKDTSTVIIGGINRGRGSDSDTTQSEATYYALATLDGSLNLVENDTILWSLHVDHYLFALAKLDVTGNGKEEVVACSWSGHTYIVNHQKETVRYDFPDSVAAFSAGYYCVRDHVNVPCFVYATFDNRIFIYPNISLPRVESTNLMKVMSRKNETKELLHKLNINADDVDAVKKLYHWCLYGQHRKS